MTIIALYARVSAKHKGQDTKNQLPELRRFAQAYGYTVYKKCVSKSRDAVENARNFKRCLPMLTSATLT